MSLMRNILAALIGLALMTGQPGAARAHAGHQHQANVASIAPADFLVIQTSTNPAHATLASKNESRASGAFANGSAVLMQDTSRQSGQPCIPGACHCRGASSCGASGHCCAAIPAGSLQLADNCGAEHRRLASLGWQYPELLFGLDRPPKA